MTDVEPTNWFLQFTAQWKPAIDFFGALLTPVIAITVAYVACQQYKTNKQRFQFETYEKRFEIYKAVLKFLSEGYPQGEITEKLVDSLFEPWIRSQHLFEGDEIADYIEELRGKGLEVLRIERTTKGRLSEEDREKLHTQLLELLGYFSTQPQLARERFRRHLRLS